MSLKAKRKVVSSIPPMDGGTYMGVCVAVVDLGQQYKQFEKQKQGKYAEECMFIFEIPDERVEVDGEDKPRWLSSRRFTVSLNERSALYQMLTSWRGKALTDAEPDGFVIPFAENYRYLKPLLAERLQTGTVAQIIELGEAAERRKAGFDRPEALSALTEREYEIVRLMAQRLNNREIAEKLYLSKGSIRQYVNQIYTKLQIAGEPRAKRKLLLDLLADKN